MPIILRIIAQRLVFVLLTSGAVLGLGPHANHDNIENEPVFEEEKEIIEKIEYPLPKTNVLETPKLPTPPPIVKKETTQTPIIKTPVVAPQIDPDIRETEVITIKKEEEPKVTIKIPETPLVDSVDSSIENVSVNIQCTRKIGNVTSLTTGSGVIISSSGVVLTNAHVAQYFLLKESGYNCSMRRENIPLYGFVAKPLYISEKWIENNHQQLKSSVPTGTGKYDYALLHITGNTNPTIPLPKFPSLSLNTTNEFLKIGDKVTVSGYPGLISYSLEIAKNASLQKEVVTIKDIYTLGNNTVDVVSSSDTSLAQRGASGGGAFKNNQLAGIIVSTKDGSNSGKFAVNILTLDYINREIRNETGKNISSFVSGDLSQASIDFETDAQHLTLLLMRNL